MRHFLLALVLLFLLPIEGKAQITYTTTPKQNINPQLLQQIVKPPQPVPAVSGALQTQCERAKTVYADIKKQLEGKRSFCENIEAQFQSDPEGSGLKTLYDQCCTGCYMAGDKSKSNGCPTSVTIVGASMADVYDTLIFWERLYFMASQELKNCGIYPTDNILNCSSCAVGAVDLVTFVGCYNPGPVPVAN